MRIFIIMLILLSFVIFTGCGDENAETPTKNGDKNVNQGEDSESTKSNNSDNPVNTGKRKYLLSLKMNLNEVRKHSIYNVFRISSTVGGVEKANRIDDEIEMTETLIAHESGVSVIEWKYQSVKKRMVQSDGKVYTVDTTDPSKSNEPVFLKIYSGIMTVPIKVHLTSNASIRKVEGSEKLMKSTLKSLLGENYEANPNKQSWQDKLENTLSEKDLEQTFHEGYFKLPDAPVSVGTTWQDEIVLGMQNVGDVAFAITLKLVQVKAFGKKLIATIEIDGKYNDASKANEISEQYGIISSKYEGSIEFNITDGSFGRFLRKAEIETSQIDDKNKVHKAKFTSGKDEKVSLVQKEDK